MKILLFICITTVFAGIEMGFFMKKKAAPYLERLDHTGIDRIKMDPENKKIWKWLEKRGYAERFLSDYVISVKFYKKAIAYLERRQILSEAEFWDFCLEAAPQFCTEHTRVLLEFLQHKEFLFLVISSAGEPYYVSADAIQEYEQLLEDSDF